MAVPNQRTGPNSRILLGLESTFDTLPNTPTVYIWPLGSGSQFSDSQGRVPVPYYTADGEGQSSVLDMIQAGGTLDTNMEFTGIGAALKAFFGPSGYTHASTANLHQYSSGFAPGSMWAQEEWLETTAQYKYNLGVRASTFGFQSSPNGYSKYSFGLMGLGDVVQGTDGASGGTKTNLGRAPVSYFNGYLKKGGTARAIVTDFKLNLDRKLSRQDVMFNGGKAGGINPGLMALSGSLTLTFNTTDNFTDWTSAVNDTPDSLECLWADLGGSGLLTATKWLRIVMPYVKFSRPKTSVGGDPGLVHQYEFFIEPDFTNGGRAGELYSGAGTAAGLKAPYVITAATNDAYSVKVDGGTAVTGTMTPGTYATAAAFVSAAPAITGATWDVFNGYPRLTSNTKGSSSSIQSQTVTHDWNATLGFDAVVHSGAAPHAIFVDLQNQQTSAY